MLEPNPIDFVLPCEDRLEILNENTMQRMSTNCMYLSTRYGHSVSCGPVMCATCMLTGNKNEKFLAKKLASLHLARMAHIALGLYNNKMDLKSMILDSFQYMRHEKDLELFKMRICEIVQYGRIKAEEMTQLVKEKMPGLIDE